MELIIIGLLGALASILANKQIAVFHDGFRPIVGNFLNGKIDRKTLGLTSFALSFGLVIGFGLPFSIGKSIILIHCILLATDIIGSVSPAGKKGLIVSGVIGGLFGIGLSLGLDVIIDAFSYLPYNFLPHIGSVGKPVVVAFAVFPALAVALQHGYKKGIYTIGAIFATMVLVNRYGSFDISGSTVSLSVEGLGLLVGVVMMIVFAIRTGETTTSNQQLVSIFSSNVDRIKKNWPWLVGMGALVAAATAANIVAGDPISLNLMADGKMTEAGIAAFARGIGFVPLIFTTAIATGVYAPAGVTFVFAIGILTGNPYLAFVLGGVMISVELLALSGAAKFLDKFAGVKNMGEHIRSAMNSVLEVALLVGSMIAANAMSPKFGFLFVIGLYTLNKTSKKPLVSIAVGPIAVIALGIILNVLALLGLWIVPA
ncbi:hypothetical protein KQ51_01533 [Candidatus Izimaplasma bacterium HR1]|jgi:hypothetical protein|uniref:YhfT family protein n=1 Tax=Candidatus Izimoplasma sp. HR1 TaxID=1541959 RepID=UPI0004F8F662|nr:hypothetical protein KQ51_01533 [Candidatus Izimaplasma bacterium HR1]